MNFNHFYVAVVLTCFAIGFQSNLVGQDGPLNKNDSYWTAMKKSFTAVRNKYREMKKLQQSQINKTKLSWRHTELDMSNHWKDRESVKKAKSKSVSKTAREYSVKNQLARTLKAKINSYVANKYKNAKNQVGEKLTNVKSRATTKFKAAFAKYQANQKAKASRGNANKITASARSNSASLAGPRVSQSTKRKDFNRYRPKPKPQAKKRPKRPFWKPKKK